MHKRKEEERNYCLKTLNLDPSIKKSIFCPLMPPERIPPCEKASPKFVLVFDPKQGNLVMEKEEFESSYKDFILKK